MLGGAYGPLPSLQASALALTRGVGEQRVGAAQQQMVNLRGVAANGGAVQRGGAIQKGSHRLPSDDRGVRALLGRKVEHVA
jgi:hypothetical protein